MDGEQRSRRWTRNLPLTFGLLAVAVAAAVVTTVVLVDSDEGSHQSSEQLDYQVRIRDSRAGLFPGILRVESERQVPVGKESRVVIWACGPDSGANCPIGSTTTSRAPDPDPSRSPSTQVPLGARVRVDLTPGDPEAMTVRSVDADADAAQPLTERDDVASWAWFVHAARPGTYPLVATVSVLAADTDTLLVPRERVDIELTITRTGAYTAGEATRSGWAIAQWVIGTVIALLGTGVITAATLSRWRRGAADTGPASAQHRAHPDGGPDA